MLSSFNELIEKRIGKAQADGAFDCLPGAGRPLDLSEDPLVPEEVRLANRVLKNAGMLPPEVLDLRSLAGLEKTLAQADLQTNGRDADRQKLRRRLVALSLSLQGRGVDLHGLATDRYRQAIINKLGISDPQE